MKTEKDIDIKRIKRLNEYEVTRPVGFKIIVKKKNIKHIYFKIRPHEDFVEISVPRRISEKHLIDTIEVKLPWMIKHHQQIVTVKPLQTYKKEYGKGQRQLLNQRIWEIVHIYEPIMGVRVHEIRIKAMKTRWGTCNIQEKRIWINASFCDKNDRLLEYIVVHEMVHLLERGHNKKFYSLMTKFLPDWSERKKELNKNQN